jgi:Phage integrase family
VVNQLACRSTMDVLQGENRLLRSGRYKPGILRFWDMKVAAFGRLARNVAAEVRKPKAQRRERPAAVLEVDRRLLQEGDPDANARILASARPGERPALLPETLRVYDLRHTCASLLIAEGASIKAVQAQLGHKTASMTLDLYGHLFPGRDRAARRAHGPGPVGGDGRPSAAHGDADDGLVTEQRQRLSGRFRAARARRSPASVGTAR